MLGAKRKTLQKDFSKRKNNVITYGVDRVLNQKLDQMRSLKLRLWFRLTTVNKSLFFPQKNVQSPPVPVCVCLASVRHSGAQSHFSQFLSLFKCSYLCTNTQRLCGTRHTHKPNTGRHSKLHTKCLQSGRRRFKMADSWLCVRVCVCVGTERSVLCWLRSWQRPSVGSIQTSNKDCTVQLRREADRGFTGFASASQLSQAAILEVNWNIICVQTRLMPHSHCVGVMGRMPYIRSLFQDGHC